MSESTNTTTIEFPSEKTERVDTRPLWVAAEESDVVKGDMGEASAINVAKTEIAAALEKSIGALNMSAEHLTNACFKVATQAYTLKAPSLVTYACRRILATPYVGKRILVYFRAWGFDVLDDGECTGIRNIKAYREISKIMSEKTERKNAKGQLARVKKITVMNCRIKDAASERTDENMERFDSKNFSGLMLKRLEQARATSEKQQDKYADSKTHKDAAAYFMQEKNLTADVMRLVPTLVELLTNGHKTVREIELMLNPAKELN